jgi:hypothetical protein
MRTESPASFLRNCPFADPSELLCDQLELEGIQRMSARRQEQEQVRREATEDLTDDLSEGEKGNTLSEQAPVETSKKKFQRNFSDLTLWSDENKEKKLYIVLIRSDTAHAVTHCHIQSFYVLNCKSVYCFYCDSY